MKRKVQVYYFFAILFVIIFACFVEISDNALIHDEFDHFAQITKFIQGNWSLDPMLTTIPGYHVIVTIFSEMTAWNSPLAARFVTFLSGIFSILVFYGLAKNLCNENALIRTFQFSFFPILFPYFFLIYTDVMALLFVLLTFLLMSKRSYHLAGLTALLSCLIRQTNIVWSILAVVWQHVSENGWTINNFGKFIKQYSIFFLTILAFIVFVIMNGGVALGDTHSHPVNSIYLTNIFFIIFLLFIFFLPLYIVNARNILLLFKRIDSWIITILLGMVYWFGFIVDHPYNIQYTEYFIRNLILVYFTSSVLHKVIFFIPVLIAVQGLRCIQLRQHGNLLYPTTVLFLLPSWLVEQRYYLVPFSLFILFREPTAARTEIFLSGWLVFLAGILFYCVERNIIFL